MQTAVIVSRCSTNETKQDVTRQTAELKDKYGSRFEIVKVFEFYKSGTNNDKELEQVLTYAINNKVDHIAFWELSRICRRVIETLTFIRSCTKHQINVVISQSNLETLNDDKSENELVKTSLHIGSLFAEIELSAIKNRLNSGRKKYITEGGRVGRNVGTTEPKEQFLAKHKDVVKLIKQGKLSIRQIMTQTKKSSGTVQKVKLLTAA